MKMNEEKKRSQKEKKGISNTKLYPEAWLNNLLFLRNYSKVFIKGMRYSKMKKDRE